MALPSIENLRCFNAAAETLSFRAAARAVALTPAALGQRIRQLEGQLGVSLFRRTTRTVALTRQGAALVPYARAALAAAGDCHRAVSGDVSPPPVELTLGTRHELGLSFVLPQLNRLRSSRKGLFINLYFGSGQDLLLRVRTREIDCAITSSRFADPVLDSVRLHREDYLFVGSPALLSRVPLVREADAQNHTLIDISNDLPLFRYWRDAKGGGDRLRFARLWRVGTIAAIRTLVLDGEGLAILPKYLVERDVARRRLSVVMPKIKPAFDYFRLVFRFDDPRRAVYEALAAELLKRPLQ
ncbi:MAG: LysR family transcriptional regulator [Deltaproteobacteria bacterium]|nr:LysR family transcriptional regulator [Deltaproteobacteria bacterium]